MKFKRLKLIHQYQARNEVLKELGFENYQEYLKSDIWRETKRIWYFKREKKPDYWGKCHICGETKGLVLHHLNYRKKNIETACIKGKIPLCFKCHGELHEFSNKRIHLKINSSYKRLRRVIAGKAEKKPKKKKTPKMVIHNQEDKKAIKVYTERDAIKKDRKNERERIKQLKEARINLWSS